MMAGKNVGQSSQRGNQNISGNANKNLSGRHYHNKPLTRSNREWKFYGNDALKKNGTYTYIKSSWAIILKIRSTFDGPTRSLLASSLWTRTNHVFSEPSIEIITKSDEDEEKLDTERLLRMWEKDYHRYQAKHDGFESRRTKSYGLIFSKCCSSELKISLQELSNFESQTREDLIQLLESVEHLMHVPMRALYPILRLTENLASMMKIKQGNNEGLLNYLERFKSEQNVM